MKAFDLHVHTNQSIGENSLEDVIDFAKRLGWSGVAVCDVFENEDKLIKQKLLIDELRPKHDIDIAHGVEIRTDDANKIKPIVQKLRKNVELIIVRGGDLALNRAALETPEVDILSHPEFQRNDSGVDHVLAKLAADNQVCIELNFREALYSFRKSRAHILTHMRRNVALSKKFGFPVVVTSGAYSKWEMRGARELAAFGTMVGLELENAMNAVSGFRVERNRARLSGGWVMPGVEKVET